MKVTDKITITNEDNIELMARYPDNYFDLAIVDPPYGININVSMGRRKGDKKSDYHKFAGNDSEIPSADYFDELKRVSKNQIVWGGNYMTEFLTPSSCWLLWDKGFSEDVTFAQFELAWTSFNSSAKKFDKHPSQNNRIHPTQKPVALYKWLLDKYAKPNDKILDTHGGSMSIAIACHDYGFDLDLCELDKEYFDKGVQRVKNHVAQTKLF
jgi:site-specific DNA-methyltransferase (adenine-specific)